MDKYIFHKAEGAKMKFRICMPEHSTQIRTFCPICIFLPISVYFAINMHYTLFTGKAAVLCLLKLLESI